MNNASITCSYKEVVITYSEHRNIWEFTLRGRERHADSLQKAKELIDRKPKKGSLFQRTDVFTSEGWLGFQHPLKDGIATSIADTKYGKRRVWVVSGRDRCCVEVCDVFPNTEHNRLIRNRLDGLRKEVEKLHKQMEHLGSKLKPITLPKGDEEYEK